MPSWILSSLSAAVAALKERGDSEHASLILRLIDDPAIRSLKLYKSREAAELAEAIAECGELEDLFGILKDLCSVFSVAHCTVQRIRERNVGHYGSKILSTYPDAWIEEYIERRFFMNDPVVARMLEGPGLFFWDELPYGGPIAEEFLRAAAAHAIGPAGITCVGENAAGDSFAVTLAVPLSPQAFRPFFTSKLADFVEIVALLIEVFSELTCDYSDGRATLTCDQIKLLRALATGNAPEEISGVLQNQVSLESLEHSILRSMNATSLTQAVAIAIKHGLLEVVPFSEEEIFRPESQRFIAPGGTAA